MGFEGNSDLLPRLLIDGGGKEVAREGGEGEAEGEEERLSPSEFFEVSALVKQRETRREMKGGGCYSTPFRLLCFNFRRRTQSCGNISSAEMRFSKPDRPDGMFHVSMTYISHICRDKRPSGKRLRLENNVRKRDWTNIDAVRLKTSW